MARRNKRVRPIDLDKAIREILEEYGDDAYEVLQDSVEEVAEDAVKKLKEVNHFAPGGHVTGAYSADWTHDKQRTSRLATKEIVHNEDHYRLTHLLEKGHVIKNGTGRTFGKTGAYPHIAPVNDWANSELPKVVERKLNKL